MWNSFNSDGAVSVSASIIEYWTLRRSAAASFCRSSHA